MTYLKTTQRCPECNVSWMLSESVLEAIPRRYQLNTLLISVPVLLPDCHLIVCYLLRDTIVLYVPSYCMPPYRLPCRRNPLYTG
jgi:hypothetical protein